MGVAILRYIMGKHFGLCYGNVEDDASIGSNLKNRKYASHSTHKQAVARQFQLTFGCTRLQEREYFCSKLVGM
jgi:hypothetical protein